MIPEKITEEEFWARMTNTPEGIDYAIKQARGATEGIRRHLGLSEQAFNLYRKEGMPENVFKQFIHILPSYF